MWHNFNIQFKYHATIFYFTLVKISLLLLTRLKQFDNAKFTTYSRPWQIVCCHLVFKDMLIVSCIVNQNLANKKSNYNHNSNTTKQSIKGSPYYNHSNFEISLNFRVFMEPC
jgi:hypothetical protein